MKLDKFIEIRKKNHDFLNKNLEEFREYFYLPKATSNSDPSWFGFLLTIRDNNNFTRNDIINFLNEKKIGTRLLFSGNIIKQPYFKDVKYKVKSNLMNTNKIMQDSFWIGVYPGLDFDHLSYVIDVIKEFIKK